MKEVGTSVRFDPETMERLRSISASSGMKIAKLIRLAAVEYLDKVETSGVIQVPVVREPRAVYGAKKKGP